jgi:hypothetical protein
MSGRTMPVDPAMHDNLRGEEIRRMPDDCRRDGGMTAGQMRWLVTVVLLLAWLAARILLRWWPHLVGQPG